jgi:DNA repair protein RecO (recombination protein O)
VSALTVFPFPIPHSSFIISGMRSEKTEAIVLQTHAARERDKLVVFLTPDHGKRKGWAYGARSLKSRFGAALEPLAKIRISYVEKEGDEMVRIESADLVRSMFPAQEKLHLSIAATYLVEMVDVFALPEDPSNLIYRLLDRSSEALLNGGDAESIVAYFEIWVLKLTGIFPSLQDCIACGGQLTLPYRYDAAHGGFLCANCSGRESETLANDVTRELTSMMRRSVDDFASARIPRETLFELRNLARTFRRRFLGHELRSHDILQSIINRSRRE